MTNQPIRLIAVDLDGTLLNSQHQITPRTERALRRAMGREVQVAIATGKTFLAAKWIIRQLDLRSPGVYVQGLVICGPTGEVLHSRTLDPEIVQQVTALGESQQIQVLGYSGSRVVMSKRDDEFADTLVAHHEPRPEVVGPLSRIAYGMPLNKLMVICPEQEMGEVRSILSEHVQGRATLVLSSPLMLEILPVGASKGAGLTWVLDHLGIDPQAVLALGDAENDIEMLRLAGVSVAVANVMQVTKDAADVVVASNDEDGVAEAVERFVLFLENPSLLLAGLDS